MSVKYTRVDWQDAPSVDTPVNAANLNHMDNGILLLSEEYDTDVPLMKRQIVDLQSNLEEYVVQNAGPIVSEWLDEHVTPGGSTVVIDDTLTIQGAAADAKKTGDEVYALKEDLNAVMECNLASFNSIFVAGKTIGSFGHYEGNDQRIATPNFINVSAYNTLNYSIASGYRVLIAFYSSESESSFVSAKYWLTGSSAIAVEADYIRLAYASLNDATALTVADASNVIITFDYAIKQRIEKSEQHIKTLMNADNIDADMVFVANRSLGSTGLYDYYAGRIATKDFIDVSNASQIKYVVDSGYRFILDFYSSPSESAFISAKYWKTGSGSIPVEGNYFRISYASLNDATPLTVADADKVRITITYKLIDDLYGLEDEFDEKLLYKQSRIVNDLKSSGIESLPNVVITKNASSSPSYYGDDNVKYTIPLPEHNKLHVRFDYQYTKNVPYAVSGYIDLFKYGSVLYGSERHLGQSNFGIMGYRMSGIYGRGTSVESISLNNDYKPRMGKPSFWVKYVGEATSASLVFAPNTVSLKVDGTVVDSVSYLLTDSIQSLIDKLKDIDSVDCGEIDTYGTCADLLMIDSSETSLIGSDVNIKKLIMFGWDRSWHTFEAVIDAANKTYVMSFDGLTISGAFNTPSTQNVVIGGDFNGGTTPIRLRNLLIDINSYGDAEVIDAPVSANATTNTKQLISNRNPRLLILEGHGVIVGSEAYAQSLTDDDSRMASSTDRLNAVFKYAIANGYIPVSWQDIIAWKLGEKDLPKKCFAIMMDDYRVENYVDYDKRRPFVKNGVKAGLAMISDAHSLSDTLTINDKTYTVEQILKMIELEGWYPCSHTRNHRNNSTYNPNELEAEYKADILSCNDHNMYSDVLVYPYGGSGYNVTSAMLLSDFVLGVTVDNGGTIYNCRATSDQLLVRTEIGSRVTIVKAIQPFV